MSLITKLCAMIAACTTGGTLVAGHVAPHAQDQFTKSEPSASTRSRDLDRHITKQFSNAPLAEVLAWLSLERVSFVADSDDESGKRRLTLNFVDAPLGDAVDAIAAALNGHWERKGQIFVFHHGRDMFPPITAFRFDKDSPWTQGPIPAQDWAKQSKEFGQQFKELAKSKAFMVMPQVHEEIERAMKGIPKGDLDRGLSETEQVEIEKSIKDIEPQIRIEIDRAMKSVPRAKQDQMKMEMKLRDTEKLLKNFRGPNEKIFRLAPKGGGQFLDQGSALPKANFKGLISSLTPSQREIMRSKGYLTLRDLTAAQKKMLGASSESGDWTLKISVDGEDVTIKNK